MLPNYSLHQQRTAVKVDAMEDTGTVSTGLLSI